ncbi:hypothetical protein AVEN_104622-1 [Araneus ventricosus]|uniref:Reverse transcriptase domain-containing protein n=1 Tax=Araneus ventricosus TaxID=182803 RepID=A0A4Y2BED9_ARAVE|nr:hypothetical protein AVEN_104622-1 [Araneus ventricosus]
MHDPYSRAGKIQGFSHSWTVFPSKTNKAAIAIVNKNFKSTIIARKKEIRNSQTQDDINKTANHLQIKITDACYSTYKTKKQEVARPLSWYTSKLEIEKNRLKALRRRSQRAPQDQRSRRFLTLKKDKAMYIRHVKRANNSSWKTFCTNASNPYGKQFKASFRNTMPPAYLIALKNYNPTGGQRKIADNIREQMFPNPLDYADLPTLRTNAPEDAPFTKEEIAIVIKNLHKEKSPEPDGTDSIIIQQINKRFPILFMEAFNKCLHLGMFPDPLKLGNIVLFEKEGKPEEEASSYRLISLLSTIGKVLEKLLTQRVSYHLERLNKISDNQYGFREGRSTELAIHTE